jgi:hypothetical protein
VQANERSTAQKLQTTEHQLRRSEQAATDAQDAADKMKE